MTPLGCTLCAVCLLSLRGDGKRATEPPPFLPGDAVQSITTCLGGGKPFFVHRNNSVEELAQHMVDKILGTPEARPALDLASDVSECLRLAKEGGMPLQLPERFTSSGSWLDSLETLSLDSILARYRAFLHHVEQTSLASPELATRLSLPRDSVERRRAIGFDKLQNSGGYLDTRVSELAASFNEDIIDWFAESSLSPEPSRFQPSISLELGGAVQTDTAFFHQDVIAAVQNLVEVVALNSTPVPEKRPSLPRLSFFDSFSKHETGVYLEPVKDNEFPSPGLLLLTASLGTREVVQTTEWTREGFADTTKALCRGSHFVRSMDWNADFSVSSSLPRAAFTPPQKPVNGVRLGESALPTSSQFNYPVIPLPLYKEAKVFSGGKEDAAEFYPWVTASSQSDKSRGIRGLFEDALLASSLPGPSFVRKQNALGHETILRALAHIISHCMVGPCVSETLSDGVRANFTGQCLISQISPAVKTHSGFPLTLPALEKGTLSSTQSLDLAHSMRTVSDLVKELGCGIISTFNKDGLHGSRAIGITEFGRSRMYDLAGLPLPPFKLTPVQQSFPSSSGFRAPHNAATTPSNPPLQSKPTSSLRSTIPSAPLSPPTTLISARLVGREITTAVPIGKPEEGRLVNPPLDLSFACESGKDDLFGVRTPEAIAAAVSHGCARAGCHIMQPKICQWLIKRKQWPCSDMSLQRRALATILERHANEYVAQFLGQGKSSEDGAKHFVGCKEGVTLAMIPLWKNRGGSGGWGLVGETHSLSGGKQVVVLSTPTPSPISSSPTPPSSAPYDEKAMLLIHFFGYVCKRAADTVNSVYAVKDGSADAPLSGLSVGKPHVSVSAHAVAVDLRVPLVEMGDKASMDRMWVSPDNESPPCAKLVAFLRNKSLEGFLEVDMEYPQLPTAKLVDKGVSAFIKSYLQFFATSSGKPMMAYYVSDAACTVLGASMGVVFPPPPVVSRYAKSTTSRAAKKQASAAASASVKTSGAGLPSKFLAPSRPTASIIKTEPSAPIAVSLDTQNSSSAGPVGGSSFASATSGPSAWGASKSHGVVDWGRSTDRQARAETPRQPQQPQFASHQSTPLTYTGEVFQPHQPQQLNAGPVSIPNPVYDTSMYSNTGGGQYYGGSAPASHYSAGGLQGWGDGGGSSGTWNGALSTAAASSVTVDPSRYTDSYARGPFSSFSHPGKGVGGSYEGIPLQAEGREANSTPWYSAVMPTLSEGWMDGGQVRDTSSFAAANAAASQAAAAASSRSRHPLGNEHAFSSWGGGLSYRK